MKKQMLKHKIFFRFINIEFGGEEESIVYMQKYYLTRETRRCWWVKRIWEDGQHPTEHMAIPESFVEKEFRISKSSAKKFAHPTIAEAVDGFIHRKRKQTEILEEKLYFVKRAHKEGLEMGEEVKRAKDNRYTKIVYENLNDYVFLEEHIKNLCEDNDAHVGCRNWPNCDTEGCGFND